MDNNDITLNDLLQSSAQAQGLDLTETAPAEVTKNEIVLTTEQRKRVDEIKSEIDLRDSQMTVQYGVGSQRNIAQFSDTILSNVRSSDTGEVGGLLTDLLDNVEDLDIDSLDEKSFLDKLPFVNSIEKKIKRMLAKYDTLQVQISRIEGKLDKARMELLKDISMFDTLYDKNLDYFKDLELYIIAGEEKVNELRERTIPALRAEANASGEPMHAQLVKDFEDTTNRFEKKVHDLKLSKTIAMQTAPQIKLIQNNNKQLVDKIQTTILNTLPLWKSQVVIALGLYRQENAVKLQREVTETTNELLTRNSEKLKQNTIDVAKEQERGIVEIETLKKVNEDLITTIEETLKIQQEGRENRKQAEMELIEMEEQLKVALLKQY